MSVQSIRSGGVQGPRDTSTHPINGQAIAASPRYVYLDGLRGVLAIAVVIHHFAFATQLHWFNKAWISVDAFFILSGFVIAHSYRGRITQGMSLLKFFKARINRLYPIYIVGLLIGTLALYISPDSPLPPIDAKAKAFLLGLLVLPYFNDYAWPANGLLHNGSIFPTNDPAWSLFFELVVNIFFFVWLRYGAKIRAAYIAAIFLIVHLLLAQHYGLHSGWSNDNFLGGLARVILFFFVGCAIHEIHPQIAPQKFSVFLLSSMAMIAGFSFRITAIDYILLFIFAPLTILIGSRVPVVSGLKKTFNWLGSISYPLYITHYPLGTILKAGLQTKFPDEVVVILSTLICIIFADLITRCERIIRANCIRQYTN